MIYLSFSKCSCAETGESSFLSTLFCILLSVFLYPAFNSCALTEQARSQITGPGGGSLAAFSFPDRNAVGGAAGGGAAGAAAEEEEEDLYS